jgi:hypothetical protein
VVHYSSLAVADDVVGREREGWETERRDWVVLELVRLPGKADLHGMALQRETVRCVVCQALPYVCQ